MFTFYDNLYGFEEKVWNICWNELQRLWVTFYSWVPSYSENIYNQYFSFDRNTSKWIAKLGVSKHDNDFSDGVTLDDNEITGDGWSTTLNLDNRNLPSGTGIKTIITYTLERDNYGNYKKFTIDGDTLKFTGSYADICSEFYERENGDKVYFTEEDATTNYTSESGWSDDYLTPWKESVLDKSDYWKIHKDERGRRVWLEQEY